MQEQSTPWMVLSIKNTVKHGAFTDSWIGQQARTGDMDSPSDFFGIMRAGKTARIQL
jgi:hypothetical protein